MKENFKKYLNNILNINGENYLRSINSISKHLSEEKSENINCYNLSKEDIEILLNNLDKEGKYADLGSKGNFTNLNAIRNLLKFKNYIDENPSFLELNNIEAVNYEYEKDLENALFKQYELLFPNYSLFTKLGKNGKQVQIRTKENSTKIIDLILESNENNHILVIELKKGILERDSFSQITEYIVLLKEKYPNTEIKGAIIGSDFESHFPNILKTSKYDISLYKYQIKVELEKISK